MSQKPIDSRNNQLENLEENFASFSHGVTFVAGKLLLTAAKSGLFGPNWSIIPTVRAAKPTEEVPQKPPKMKYKDLPLYSTPHIDYKDYLDEKEKCPGLKRRLIHESIYPCVRDARRSWCKTYCDLSNDLGQIKREINCSIRSKKTEFINYMRCPNNLSTRQVVLVLGGLTGFCLGSGRIFTARRFIFTGFGLLAAGALCFPKETDDAFRNFTYYTSKFVLNLYNIYCNKNFGLREKVPCSDNMPEPLVVKKKTPKNECPKK